MSATCSSETRPESPAVPVRGARSASVWVAFATVILKSLHVPVEDFERETGWLLKPEGACRGSICVPLPWARPTLDAGMLAERLGMPLIDEEPHGLWALGPATVTGRALDSVEAPDFVLPDLDGRPFQLRSLRGQKVVLVAWASW